MSTGALFQTLLHTQIVIIGKFDHLSQGEGGFLPLL